MITEMTPAMSEARAPQIMREKTSRPISSVPMRCSRDGALRNADQLVADGSSIGSIGASSAITTTHATMAEPASALWLVSSEEHTSDLPSLHRLSYAIYSL